MVSDTYLSLELANSNMEKAIERSQKYINIITAYTPETFTGDYEATIAGIETGLEFDHQTADSEKQIVDELVRKSRDSELIAAWEEYSVYIDEVWNEIDVIHGYVQAGDYMNAGMELGINFTQLVTKGEAIENAYIAELMNASNESAQNCAATVAKTKLLNIGGVVAFAVVV